EKGASIEEYNPLFKNRFSAAFNPAQRPTFESLRVYTRFAFLLVLLFYSLNGEATAPKQVIEEILSYADIKIDGERPFDIKVHDSRFYERVLKDRSLGLGESYMEGWWSVESLDECMHKIIGAKLSRRVKPTWAMIWNVIKAKFLNLQTKGTRSTRVIDVHYELGNDLYELMLGSTMAYTCGYWKEAKTLDEAQIAKFDLIAKKLHLKKGMRVLELGCGWGGFAKYIAENYGVEVVAVNLSAKQVEYARKLCTGLPVKVQQCDYREAVGIYDRVVSIGLLEHVGKKNYRNFMELVSHRLKEDGLALIHTIGRNTSSIVADAWISRYIFPHGHLPSIQQIGKSIEKLFVMEDWHNFSASYDQTLMAWFHNFDQNWEKIKYNYPEPFYNMWKYYLLSCAAAFRSRDIQLWQFVLSKNGVLGGYDSIR
ncbi:MAG TPA: cyclopropane fatty acyl phospholipid synthase, partial [Chlamydiales bacterium]|nr:cyclopropane fatty acyl phospholipid synthase [Chlamydiales bacterium]